jgi:Phage tail sheath protein subtilisin-like domain/Phage tail sheath C-terminal domain
MATPQLSPGVLTREVDLTVGRADNVLDNIGAIAGPFTRGPVNEAVDITTENGLINVFGKPVSTDAQYEYWMTASSFLSYGGVMKVVRADGATLNNANAAVGFANTTSLKIKNYDDYTQNYSSDNQNWVFAAKNPGSWANNLKVCVIDDKADQTIGISTINPGTSGVVVGYGVSVGISTNIAVAGYTTAFSGYLKGIITGVTTDSVLGASSFDVKIYSRVDTNGAEYPVDYKQGAREASYKVSDNLIFINNSSNLAGSLTANTVVDWYDQQQLNLTNGSIYWKSIAPKPVTSSYASQRAGRFDEVHVVVVDDKGTVTGIQGNLVEKFTGLSKATDAISAVNSPQRIFWKQYLADNSSYVYGGDNPGVGNDTYNNTSPRATGFSTNFTAYTQSQGQWDIPAQGVVYNAIGNVTYTLGGGVDYSASNGMTAALGDLITAYGVFSNKEQVKVDYLIMGPGLTDPAESQAKANYLLSIANDRKDCMATISPHRGYVVNVTNSTTQTQNIINFYSALSSSSYAVFDSGYKYTYDRFNNQFRYIPCNGDVAGLMVRTTLVAYPWFSPAGQQRGILNNAIKLAYNPNKAQRDQLYPLRINSIVNQNGIGILLYGDKTGLGYASAFDRINVRRLFLTIEQALQRSANAQLFELNDQVTRSNFVNIVEPYLRDIQAKRGLYDFLVVCDETNNTPDVIDNNEFRADIYLKPAKSINYVTLTFVATRTGVSFEEVAGRV